MTVATGYRQNLWRGIEMKRILVTGGAGLIGSFLCERLVAEGHEVLCVDNFFSGAKSNVAHLGASPNFELIRRDVCEPIRLEVDQLYHLARPAAPVHYQYQPVKTIRAAVEGTVQMLELASSLGIRIVIASSGEVYGDTPDALISETGLAGMPLLGMKSCFIEGNRCSEAIASAYQAQFGTDVRIARIFNTYGPRMPVDDGRVISNFILQALDGSEITIFGDGEQKRSFCYVDDMIDGLIRLMNADVNPAVVNLGSNEAVTIKYLAELVVRMTGSSSPIIKSALPDSDPKKRCPDISHANQTLGFVPRVSLDVGIVQTIEYFERAVADDIRPCPRRLPTPPPLPCTDPGSTKVEA